MMFFIFLFLLGLGMVLLPYISGAVVDRNVQKDAEIFLEQVPSQPQIEMVLPAEKEDTPPMENQALWDACTDYNACIWQERQAGLRDPWSYQQSSLNLSNYDVEDDIFAVISIPRLEVKLPIYLGASNEHLTLGAAHLTQTSLPIGGSSTNCVLAGHRGWHGASFFRDIVVLMPGDEVLISNLWGQLRYTVTETKIIPAQDVDSIRIREGRDMVTLLTCYYPNPNEKVRFLVICDRNEITLEGGETA